MDKQTDFYKNDFINRLYYYLKLNDLSEIEIEEIISDYEAHFIEGKNNGLSDVEIINDLGDPLTIAKQFVDEKGKPFREKHPEPTNIDEDIEIKKNSSFTGVGASIIWGFIAFILGTVAFGLAVGMFALWAVAYMMLANSHYVGWILLSTSVFLIILSWVLTNLTSSASRKTVECNKGILSEKESRRLKRKVRITIYSLALAIGLIVFTAINTAGFDFLNQNFNYNNFDNYNFTTSSNNKHEHELKSLTSSINIDIDVGDIEIAFTNSQNIQLLWNDNRYPLELADATGVIYIRDTYKSWNSFFNWFGITNNFNYKILIPYNYSGNLSIDANVGDVEFDGNNQNINHTLEELNINLNVGELEVEDVYAKKYFITGNIGDISFERRDNEASSYVEIKNDIGKIEVDFPSRNIQYDINTSLGSTKKPNNNHYGNGNNTVKCSTNIGDIIIKNNLVD